MEKWIKVQECEHLMLGPMEVLEDILNLPGGAPERLTHAMHVN